MKVRIITDLGFGDSGKGVTVDALGHEDPYACMVVRYNGGSQAAHNVHTPKGLHHTHAQFGSTALSGIGLTYLSEHMLIEPYALMREALSLQTKIDGNESVIERLFIHDDATVITPFHKAANRIRESLRDVKHGTCGLGIGETVSTRLQGRAMSAKMLVNTAQSLPILEAIQNAYIEEFKNVAVNNENKEWLEVIREKEYPKLFADSYESTMYPINIVSEILFNGMVDHFSRWPESMAEFNMVHPNVENKDIEPSLIFEGAQGVLLDEKYGFAPHNTWSNTTPQNAYSLLKNAGYSGQIENLGVIRAFQTRHGAGPMPTHNEMLSSSIPDSHNISGGWQGAFRVGWLDVVLIKHALAICKKVGTPIDGLVVTNLDRLSNISDRKICVGYKNVDIGEPDVADAESGLMTHLLNKAEPEYVSAPDDIDEYVALIEELVGVPVVRTQSGRTYLDHKVRIPA